MPWRVLYTLYACFEFAGIDELLVRSNIFKKTFEANF